MPDVNDNLTTDTDKKDENTLSSPASTILSENNFPSITTPTPILDNTETNTRSKDTITQPITPITEVVPKSIDIPVTTSPNPPDPTPMTTPLSTTSSEHIDDIMANVLHNPNIPESSLGDTQTFAPAEPPTPPKPIKKKHTTGVILSVVLILFITLPLTVFVLTQQQQIAELRGKAQEGPYPSPSNTPTPSAPTCAIQCTGLAEEACYVHAGSGCSWRLPDDPNKPHWEGSCVCGPPNDPGTGDCKLTCGAGSNGVSVSGTGNCQNVQIQYFAQRCNRTDGFCSGGEQRANGVPFSRGLSGSGCSYQADVSASGNGGSCNASDNGFTSNCANNNTPTPTSRTSRTPTPTLRNSLTPTGTPTPTPINQCVRIRVYKNNEVVVPSTLQPGDQVVLAVAGTALSTKGRIRVNGAAWNETAQKNSNGEYFVDFTIPTNVTNFTIEAEVFSNNVWQ